MGDLSRNFDRSEFACRCGCGLDRIDPALIANLQHSRDTTGLTYTIASGCRCVKHNASTPGSSKISAHLPKTNGAVDEQVGTCHAADIQCTDDHSRYLMMFDVIRRFKRVEVRESWIHVDIDDSLPQEVLFLK